MIDDATRYFLPVREPWPLASAPRTLAGRARDRLPRPPRASSGPSYNAVVTVMRETALAEAQRRPRRKSPRAGTTRAAARHSLRREGPGRDQERADQPGVRRPTRISASTTTPPSVEQLRAAGAVLVRQARHGRAGGRHGLQPRRRLVHRARARRRGTRSSGAAAPPAVRARRSRPGWCRSRSAPRPRARS